MPDTDGLPSLEETIAKIQSLRESSDAAAEAEDVSYVPATDADIEAGSDEGPDSAPEAQAQTLQEKEQPEPVVESEPDAEVISPKLRRIMEREAKLIERETKLAEKEKVAPQAESPKREMTVSELRRLYAYDRAKAMKVLDENFAPGRLAKEFFVDEMGDAAPKDARAEINAQRAMSSAEALRAEMDEREARLQAMIQQQRDEWAYHQYRGAMEAFSQSIPEDMPLVSKFHQKKPEKVVAALMGVAQKYFNKHGQPPTPAEAAKQLEASLKELQLVDPAPAVDTTPNESEAVKPKTLRNKHTSVVPSRVPDDTLDDEVLFKRAMANIERAKKAAAASNPFKD